MPSTLGDAYFAFSSIMATGGMHFLITSAFGWSSGRHKYAYALFHALVGSTLYG